MTNFQLAQNLLLAMARAGVQEIVLCAGARNAPLVDLLSRTHGIQLYSFFEERSAAFFSIGRILATGKPVAVVTTSGTAAAELLPAVIEADYQALPLLVVTADRPSRFRGSGSPQTIVQPGMFSSYVEKTWDLENSWNDDLIWSRRRPAHVNVCFDEPLLDGPAEFSGQVSPAAFEKSNPGTRSSSLSLGFRKPLIILGGLSHQRAEELLPLLQKWQRPIWAEATSRLRRHPLLSECEVRGGNPQILDFDGVIRIGGVPTLRFWRDLENSKVPVWNFSDVPFSGLPRAREVLSPDALFEMPFDFEPWSRQERDQDAVRAERLEQLIQEFPLSEPAWVRCLSQKIPIEARVFLGNSLPIREWDLAACTGHYDIFANRGVNGIDGLVSTFYGVADSSRPNWAVLGDLSALYDLTGPWALKQRALAHASIAIINNGGGKIFERIFQNPLFENRHELNFEAWASMWGLSYKKLDDLPSKGNLEPFRVVEIVPSPEQTTEFWRQWEPR